MKKSWEVNIPVNVLVRRGCGFDPLKRKLVKPISHSTYWSDWVADLIPFEDQLKLLSHPTSWSEGVAGLIP